MTGEKIDALLALRSDGRLLVGRDRIKLLEAVAEHGSITKAAKAAGFSYKTAWDAVDAINNLLPSPAFITKAGGRSGGGAHVTEEGRRLIETFHRLEARMSRISSLIAQEGFAGHDDFALWSLGIKISTRNMFQTEVVSVRRWPVDVEVTLKVTAESMIHAIVTNEAADELGLAPGRKALALIKSSFVRLSLLPRPRRGGQGRAQQLQRRRQATNRRRTQQRSADRHRFGQNHDVGDRAPDRRGSRNSGGHAGGGQFQRDRRDSRGRLTARDRGRAKWTQVHSPRAID